jgi:hypothetical protein
LNDSFQQVKTWLFSSGLLVSEKSKKNCGGVYSYFDEKSNTFSFLYPEITGYFISTIKFLNHIQHNEKYSLHARQSSDWLIQIYEKYGSIIQGIHGDLPTSNISYSFDSSICAKGLLDYYEISKDTNYLNYAKKILYNLRDEYLESDGSLIPSKDLDTNTLNESGKVWYQKKGCFHIKAAIPFFQINQYLDNDDFLKIGSDICNNISNFQNSNGSIRLHIDSDTINLHTLCYALEGLIYGYSVTKNDEYLVSIKKATNWCLEQITDDGSIDLWHNSKFKSKAAYPIAQLVRILILIDKIDEKSKHQPEIERLYNFLITFQASHVSEKINGGFYEEFYKSVFGWKKRLRVNSWTSMFALQSIYWYHNQRNLKFDEQINFLY